jgi:hypothetical protein
MKSENVQEAQRLLRLVARLQMKASEANARDIDVLCALGFHIRANYGTPFSHTYWMATAQSSDQSLDSWLVEKDGNERALALLQGMAVLEEEQQAARLKQDVTDLHGATMQVRNGNGDPVYKVTQFERVFFNGADGSEVVIGVDQDGNLRLWADGQLVILPVSTNTVKVIEMHNRIRTVQA